MKVLVTDSEYKHSLAAARALKRSQYEVHALGRRRSMSAFSNSVSKSHVIETDSEGALISKIVEVARQNGIQALLPIGARSVFAVHKGRDQIRKDVAFAIAPPLSLELALDKSLTLSHARQIGVSCPTTWSFSSLDTLCNVLPTMDLPLVIKSSSELYKFEPIYLFSAKDIEEFVNDHTLYEKVLPINFLVQEMIIGSGAGFFALYQEGKCKRIFMHRRVREHPATGGSSWAARSIHNSQMAEFGLNLLDSLEWHGPAMVEFKLRENSDEPVLMELNPKFWGSLDLAISSGVDFASDTVQVALGENVPADYRFSTQAFFVWPLEHPDKFIRDKELRNNNFETNVTMSDPLPALFQLSQFLYHQFSQLLHKSLLGTIFYWLKKHKFSDFISRVVGQLFGIPLASHCQVTSWLWVGARPSKFGISLLKFRNFDACVSLLESDVFEYLGGSLTRYHFPFVEFTGLPTRDMFKCASAINDLHVEGKKIFIHCREGVGRAPSMAIATLTLQGNTLADARILVESKRTVTSLNSKQIKSLHDFQVHLQENH